MKMDGPEMFYRDIKSLIRNLLCENPNLSNGYFHAPNYSKFDLRRDTKERGQYILDRMEETRHLLGLTDEMPETVAAEEEK